MAEDNYGYAHMVRAMRLCKRCGVVVYDELRHDLFHDELAGTVEKQLRKRADKQLLDAIWGKDEM